MRERDWLNRVIAMAEAYKWSVWHVAAPMRSDGKGGFVGDARAAGLPDLILISDDPPRLIFAELKGTGGKLSDKQQEFLQAALQVADAAAAFVEDGWDESVAAIGVYTWFPDDEEMVEQVLRSKVLA